jgi:hypothetical protein
MMCIVLLRKRRKVAVGVVSYGGKCRRWEVRSKRSNESIDQGIGVVEEKFVELRRKVVGVEV